MMRITLCRLGAHAFDDVIQQCYYALVRLGFQVELRDNQAAREGMNILFGAHLIPEAITLPPASIIYNLEQTGSRWFTPLYVERLRTAMQVWDYSLRNIIFLREQYGIEARHVFPGYVPEMRRLAHHVPPDIDVLFYGATNPRRLAVLEAIRARGLTVLHLQGVYNRQRDAAICRAALVLNVHYYVPPNLEVSRLGYLWANSKPVLCERHPDLEMPQGLDDACGYVPYDDLPDAAVALLRKPSLLQMMGEAGFAAFSRLSLTDTLRDVLGVSGHGSMPASPAVLPVPEELNIGSGKDFRPECLNMDISDRWSPDVVSDITHQLFGSAQGIMAGEPHADRQRDDLGACSHTTERFGPIRLMPAMFARIWVHDVLEHLHDLPTAMNNVLHLLRDGGTLHLRVPYDLSHGAWQDPTHCRAFNEHSWLYYTDWHWYMGWRAHRFELCEQAYILSAYGEELRASGMEDAALLRQPRAVDALQVVLRKRPTTEAEQAIFDSHTRPCLLPGMEPWEC